MIKKKMSNNIVNIVDTCFYGCKLDMKTLIWKCKFFDDVQSADRFALSGHSMSTRLLPVRCIFAKNPNFVKQTFLKSDLAFEVKLD